MERQGKYIYGILSSNKELFFGSYGATSREDVYTVSCKDIAAVISDSEIINYTHIGRETLALFLLGHQRVIEEVMGSGHTIIPVKLGTFAKDEAEVKEILVNGYSLIKGIFANIFNKIEIDVCATWGDYNSAIKEVGEERGIKELKEKLLADSKGITVDDQMKIGFMLKKALDKKRDGFTLKIQETLKAISLDSRAHELMDDKMVANLAFVIDRDNQKTFDREVEKLNIEFDEKLNFRCVGPLPPYSFCTLEVKKLEFEEIVWAKEKLGLLNESAAKQDIKKAYQTKAISFHPDKNPGAPVAEKEFNDVSRAYKALLEYCQGESCSFKEGDFKKSSILVKVRE